MKISKATRKFENWLGNQVPLVKSDLQLKHKLMAEDAFVFLRGAFYRWAQVWEDVCPDLARAPQVLAVGDLHVENFGTWRDREVDLFGESTTSMKYTQCHIRTTWFG